MRVRLTHIALATRGRLFAIGEEVTTDDVPLELIERRLAAGTAERVGEASPFEAALAAWRDSSEETVARLVELVAVVEGGSTEEAVRFHELLTTQFAGRQEIGDRIDAVFRRAVEALREKNDNEFQTEPGTEGAPASALKEVADPMMGGDQTSSAEATVTESGAGGVVGDQVGPSGPADAVASVGLPGSPGVEASADAPAGGSEQGAVGAAASDASQVSSGVEQQSARLVHTQEVGGANPSAAPNDQPAVEPRADGEPGGVGHAPPAEPAAQPQAPKTSARKGGPKGKAAGK